jgi:hypothetical protein
MLILILVYTRFQPTPPDLPGASALEPPANGLLLPFSPVPYHTALHQCRTQPVAHPQAGGRRQLDRAPPVCALQQPRGKGGGCFIHRDTGSSMAGEGPGLGCRQGSTHKATLRPRQLQHFTNEG